jgi:hypothetical protein
MTLRKDNRELRSDFVDEIASRLIGPSSPHEEMRERPNKRYLTGMLFPRGTSASNVVKDEEELAGDETFDDSPDEAAIESPTDLLFQKLPASVGLTFALDHAERSISVAITAAEYLRVDEVVIAQPNAGSGSRKPKKVWRRSPLARPDSPEVVSMPAADGQSEQPVLGGRATLHLFIRRAHGVRIATVSLINERIAPDDAPVQTEDILFQIGVRCTPSLGIPAYPDSPSVSEDPEAEELALQYRELPAFAVGHGCGVSWVDAVNDRVSAVAVDHLPSVEVPPVTTEIKSLPAAVKDALSLQRLQSASFDPFPAFKSFIEVYRTWRKELAKIVVAERFAAPRQSVLGRIDSAIARMQSGVELLEATPAAMGVFRQANRAMLLSMARTKAAKDRKQTERYADVGEIDKLSVDAFIWRPFQLAFFLLSLRGLWEPTHKDREVVDLIWFPTGGGKTEAYLAVSAFEMIRRRVIDGKKGEGTAVIKRYTLRLLTIQQFERAGSLICALETLRRRKEILSDSPFSLGLWVGGESSPNDYGGEDGAIAELQRLRNTVGRVEGAKVPLKHCPVCATLIVPVEKEFGDDRLGLRQDARDVIVFCPDKECPFHDELPISFIDAYLYDHPPTMLLGTIDKFAMLAWRDEARAFFGVGKKVQPPSLIIQDELHLISGPLGTLAGVYEASIDTAISSLGTPAKYICATATIRRADDQIRKLYGRRAALFPPPGLNASDSFFSRSDPATPGRLYIGSMGQGHTATFSNVIVSSALLAAGGAMRDAIGDIADPWWTLIAYHNSKRELGKTLSLARDDIPARLLALGENRKVSGSGVKELSANLKDSAIPEALHQLSVPLPSQATLDFVACTNMLSVGVDVQRLGLMMVNGQPKTVSEYIQASSRVGRDSNRLPGVVFALFSPTKPRDRSHYEFFRPFHKGYYRHVEPTSVTPFALPSMDRGLHGAFVALVRMVSSIHDNRDASKIVDKKGEIDELMSRLLSRIEAAADGDISESRGRLEAFVDHWTELAAQRRRNLRFQSGGQANAALIKPFNGVGTGWETLQSLRNVDVGLRLLVPTLQQSQPAGAQT